VLSPIFGLVLLNLLGTHWPDRAADAQVGRRSLAVLLGRRARLAHHALVVAIYLGVLLLASRGMPREVALGVLLSLPVALWAAFVYGRQESPMPSSLTMVVGMVGAGAGWIAAGSV
jgi:1,4-dihydroxy-2-naphthoate octaprenyltransferase